MSTGQDSPAPTDFHAYTVTQVITYTDPDGSKTFGINLDNAFESKGPVLRPREHSRGVPVPKVGQSVLVCPGMLRDGDFKDELVEPLQVLYPWEIDCGALLLPRRLCPSPSLLSLDRLVAFHQDLSNVHLKRFLTSVLMDPRIGTPFIQCKGSQNHHHAYAGGLLDHSVQPLEMVRVMAQNACRKDLSAVEPTLVAFLLHDIGKVRTVGSDERPDDGHYLRHEFWNGQLLARHLMDLEDLWPEGAYWLRYTFDFIDSPASVRKFAKFPGAEVVVKADQLDVAGGIDKPWPNLAAAA